MLRYTSLAVALGIIKRRDWMLLMAVVASITFFQFLASFVHRNGMSGKDALSQHPRQWLVFQNVFYRLNQRSVTSGSSRSS